MRKDAVCRRCGDVLSPLDSALSSCRPCRLAPPPFIRAVSYGPYEGRMRDAIHALKYDGLIPAARRLGRMLGQAMGELSADAPSGALVIPVPLHRSKSAKRGFNQARVLASHALAGLRVTHPRWRLTLASSTVVRQRATKTQAGLTPRQRRQNVRSAFIVPDSKAVAGRDVIVIDDIMTTGATARSVAQALRRAGASNVWVATLARARHEVNDRPASRPIYSHTDLGKATETASGREPSTDGQPEMYQASF